MRFGIFFGLMYDKKIMDLPNRFAFVDVETTGGNPKRDRIIEIGILVTENDSLVESLSTVVNPLIYIPPEIKRLTGITQAEIDKAPLFEDIQGKIHDLLTDSLFVAHNARFDYGFIKNEFARVGNKFSEKMLCTVKLSRKLFPHLKHHNLDSIINEFHIDCENRHRAFDDAKVLFDFLNIIKKITDGKILQEHLTQLLKAPSLPPHLSPEKINKLPESPGIYFFYGSDTSLLYVGKSINIKERVKSHFTNDYSSSKEMRMAREIHDIMHIETAGELGALIRESTLVKQFCPIYNRQLRLNRKLIVAEKSENEYGYLQIKLKEVNTNEIVEPENILAIYKSFKQAKENLYDLAKEHELCPKLLDLENGKGACFFSQIEKCRGACVQNENFLKYNIRFLEAFSHNRIEKWPYPSVVEIVEESLSLKEYHLIDNWYYLGSIIYKNDSDHPDILLAEKIFDWDIYKILKRFVLHKKNRIKIQYPDKTRLRLMETSTISSGSTDSFQ